MTDEKAIPEAFPATGCHPRDPQRRSGAGSEDERGKCANGTRLIPSVQELEEVLHSAARSCRHCDEVWPNLYLGDM